VNPAAFNSSNAVDKVGVSRWKLKSLSITHGSGLMPIFIIFFCAVGEMLIRNGSSGMVRRRAL
jgi:hypothetical protein